MFCVLVMLSLVQRLVGGDYVYSTDGKCKQGDIISPCVRIRDCPVALQSVIDKKETQICSFEGIEPVVCCKEPQVEEKNKDMSRKEEINSCNAKPGEKLRSEEITSNPMTRCNEYRSRLLYPCVYNESAGVWYEEDYCQFPDRAGSDYRFGEDGGKKDADRHQYRHMALVLYGDKIQLDLFCGGSVLSERYILTAAHCASSASRGSATTAVTGILKLSDPQELWRMNKIKRFIKHPEYKSPKKYHDIALIETAERMLLDANVVPICVRSELEPQLSDDDTEASATGWGALGNRQPFSDNLKDVQLSRNVWCTEVYGPHRNRFQGFDDKTMLCYGSDDGQVSDTCQGDSGGPLQIKLAPCQYMAIGVTSFGKKCATRGVPAVYTRVGHYVPWIQSVVWPERDHTDILAEGSGHSTLEPSVTQT